MRFSTSYMYQRNVDSMSNATVNFNNVYTRLSAGQTLLKPSDDPAAASQAIIYKNALSDINQYDTARMFAQDALGYEDNALNSITNLLTKNLTEKIVQAGNDTYSDADREALAVELEGIRDSLLDLGNSKNSNGRYIFGGYNSDSPPFLPDGTYVGGDKAITQKVGDSAEMQIGHTGSDIFMSGTSDDLFVALDNAITALRQPVETDADREALRDVLDNTNRSINKCIDNLGKVQAQVGTNLQQLEQLGFASDVNKISVESRYEQTIGADSEAFISLTTQAAMADFALQASMLVFQSMKNTSLFNMM
ncbi:flagellar hook-associated protein FlgL [Morganella morganii]|uniref:flagellar hook-associated protein FlgL n=1 Tax=Morganella morganii TaxID=582 RepID=UPI0021D383C3|nr:flagellar hook-associated protein FlgL [Morganella morganii]MCU6212425.1 flagellar hook-associated protein FlgL [Morganella morganii]MCU6222932.1 flagellar hook-associated protein FlgL [Morganella morganii]MCU6233284.1 flagellar hook-associated protein FlgL [Morganella morganii]MCU6237596.1 flagellar hook-associated protein FlgL [Morganella morganii]MCU6275430.1 flagellar hook-associated protein FlgL [Morganella morganii]